MTSPAPPTAPRVAAIVVAAGGGSRFGGETPKQYVRLGGVMVLTRTLRAFLDHPAVDIVQVVIGQGQAAAYADAVAGLTSPKLAATAATGCATRQTSVLAGLEALATADRGMPNIVLIHDAARPFVSPALLDRAIAAAVAHGAAVPGVPVADTIVTTMDGRVVAPTDRPALRAVQTPQAFRFDLILKAHREAVARGETEHTDDGGVARVAGHVVHIFEGEPGNVKITTREDFARAEARLMRAMVSRTGQGFDVHAFGPGDHVWLGGIRIPHDRGVIAHSDGDAALHALTDALLAALADGDIGRHFPPSEPQWKGASSDRFLAFAVERLARRGGVIDLLDLTILAEAPRIGPYAEAMRARIAAIAGVSVGRVSVKATTTEKLGFTGRREGIAALASVTVRLPEAELG